MIDYLNLAHSEAYYTSLGFERIETPWMVSEYVDNLTKPSDVKPFIVEINKKHLVASGEQSFLELHLKRYLPNGRYQTITPCFRSDRRDNLHCKTFMKNELIITDDVTEVELTKMINQALHFFSGFFSDLEIVKTDIGYDIEVNGEELGSYGIREFDSFRYIYGTGCAEPRLSRLIKKYKNGR
jgi:hypothetical protein